ncbi:glyoxalase/bleomycin resistance protein/dioxygenase [Kluyvera georgiana ATCC 51603]|uniref:Glyoxalase/bleomycin resistance protein/dioxygenase n=1 Tax=Kluyvera georgiana ATCC 51603 TaxID=1354264 RepID=A0A1B7JWU4_9ENTR|nr:glyoxalase/bleomycin resistance protein/dioxygenase [Kluyvera georgiana ATCC 51603]
MSPDLSGLNVMFVAGFGPVTRDTHASKSFYIDALNLPLKAMDGNSDYFTPLCCSSCCTALVTAGR